MATAIDDSVLALLGVALARVYRREIRKAPEQYLWFHDRWRNARKRGLIT